MKLFFIPSQIIPVVKQGQPRKKVALAATVSWSLEQFIMFSVKSEEDNLQETTYGPQ